MKIKLNTEREKTKKKKNKRDLYIESVFVDRERLRFYRERKSAYDTDSPGS